MGVTGLTAVVSRYCVVKFAVNVKVVTPDGTTTVCVAAVSVWLGEVPSTQDPKTYRVPVCVPVPVIVGVTLTV